MECQAARVGAGLVLVFQSGLGKPPNDWRPFASQTRRENYWKQFIGDTMQRSVYFSEVRVKLRRQPLIYLFSVCALIFCASLAVQAQQVDPKTYGAMKWRLIGPFRGGRAITVAGVP